MAYFMKRFQNLSIVESRLNHKNLNLIWFVSTDGKCQDAEYCRELFDFHPSKLELSRVKVIQKIEI